MAIDWDTHHTCGNKYACFECHACKVERWARNKAMPRVANVREVSLRWDEHKWTRFTDEGTCIHEECIDTRKGPYPYAMRTFESVEQFNKFWTDMVERGWKVVPAYVYPNEKEGK